MKEEKKEMFIQSGRPKKQWGQNFLRDPEALRAIVDAADLQKSDKVLEIGPGEGVLTRELLRRVKQVKAIELDSQLANNLASKKWEGLEIIEGDFLGLDLPWFLRESRWNRYKVVSNIPYYITGKIIRIFLETEIQPESLVLLVQKEVAERICATKKGGNKKGMSILAVAVQVFGEPQFIKKVPRESFWPVPEVDSAILKIIPHESPFLKKTTEKAFFQLVKMGFSSPRKQLVNNLKAAQSLSRKELEEIFHQLDLSLRVRPGELSIKDWKKLLDKLA